MNNLKIKVHKTVLKDVSEGFIYSRTDEICSQEKLSTEEEIYFLLFLVCFLETK